MNNLFTSRKEQINNIFDEFFDKISSVANITDELLEQLKTAIGKLFIKSKK
jgi:hypothetical protein